MNQSHQARAVYVCSEISLAMLPVFVPVMVIPLTERRKEVGKVNERGRLFMVCADRIIPYPLDTSIHR